MTQTNQERDEFFLTVNALRRAAEAWDRDSDNARRLNRLGAASSLSKDAREAHVLADRLTQERFAKGGAK